tara:strand:+ start:2816 stop:3700 length:885 start_codon:yes stop_codon:yes gene_type:complete
MNNESIYILEDRGIIYVNGNDAFSYLQNIISNDLIKVTDNQSCFSYLLTPQGKYLFEFIVIKHKGGYFLDCPKYQIENLYKQLTLYKLRTKVDITNLSNEFVVAALSKDKFFKFENTNDKIGMTIKFREDPIILDPRCSDLGARIIINLEKLYLSAKKLDLKISNVHEYYQLSHSLGIPSSDTKNFQNKIFGLETNSEELNAIDFKKGCYVGQENTARMKLKEKIRRRIYPIEIVEGNFDLDEIIKINNSEIGKIVNNSNFPFGLFKFKDPNFKLDKILNTDKGKIKVKKPFWI